ncbi:MAG: tyrosine-type recombinase/integrase [Ruminococcus bromii]|nr:tyrosine-type recombinase/integrase [Ruminococcus bromii]
MKTNTMTISSPLLFGNMTFTAEVSAQSQPKLKKDGTPKIIVQNKKRGRKSEVYPIQVSDIRRFMDWFESNKKWECYLIFVISCNLARRIGDTLSLQWKHFYDTKTGRFRKDLLEIIEDKTDKLANPHINTAVKNAIVKYLAETNVDPSENNYENYVFTQVSGNYKGRVMTADGYRKCLKKAAVALGIDYNVGTHSTRKTFGMLSRMLHAGDYDSMALLGVIYNHRDEKTTRRYTGLTKQKVDTYFDDMGTFFDDYVTGGKTFTEVAETPVVHIDVNDLRDIIKMAYTAGAENSTTNDPTVHIDAINEIWAMIDGLKK